MKVIRQLGLLDAEILIDRASGAHIERDGLSNDGIMYYTLYVHGSTGNLIYISMTNNEFCHLLAQMDNLDNTR